MGETNFDELKTNEVQIAKSYSGAGSYQPIGVDLNLGAGVGSDSLASSKYLAPIMGNALAESALTNRANYVAGLIGKYNVPGEVASLYPTGGVVGEIGEDVGNPTAKPDGAIIAVIGGDGGRVNPRAMFAARHLNSNSGSGPEFGVDLYDPHAAALSYNALIPSKGEIRFSNQQWFVALEVAITANTTTTTAPAGSIGITSHATGRGKLFASDGSKWQFASIS